MLLAADPFCVLRRSPMRSLHDLRIEPDAPAVVVVAIADSPQLELRGIANRDFEVLRRLLAIGPVPSAQSHQPSASLISFAGGVGFSGSASASRAGAASDPFAKSRKPTYRRPAFRHRARPAAILVSQSAGLVATFCTSGAGSCEILCQSLGFCCRRAALARRSASLVARGQRYRLGRHGVVARLVGITSQF